MIKFWNFVQNKNEENVAELLLYGELCSDEPWYTDDYVAYRQFIQDLKEITADTIHLRINSPGGEVMAANAIFNQLKDSGKKIIAHIDGMCASAATIPLMAAEKIIASCNAMILIHDPLIGLCGYYNSTALNEMQEYCEKIKESIIATYRSRITDVSEEEFSALMTEERWLDANEAQDIGLVDEVAYSNISDIKDHGKYVIVNSVKVKKEHFKNLPVNSRIGVGINTTTHMHSKNENENEGGSEHMEEIKTLDDLKKAYPELCDELVTDAVETERTRLQDLDKIGAAVPEEMLNKAKYDEPMDAKELAFTALIAEKNLGENFMNQMQQDLAASNTSNVNPSPESGDVNHDSDGATGSSDSKNVDPNKVKGLADAMATESKRRGRR